MSSYYRSLILLLLLALTSPSVNAETIIPTIPESEARYDALTVTLNGKDAPVWSCRVSAMPFNRVWPGYQRALDQTELAGFVTWETNEENTDVVVRVGGDVPLESVVVRPSSLKITPKVDHEKLSKIKAKKYRLKLKRPFNEEDLSTIQSVVETL